MLGFNGGLIGKDRNTAAAVSVPGVWTLGEQVKAQRSLLWPPNTVEDLYFANVSLLLRGDGTNGSTTFTDGSSNNFAITPVGNAQISTTQSKFGGASMYFDGNSDYLTVADNAALQLGSGNFTIEFWIYFNTLSGYQTPFDKGVVSTNALLFQTGNGNGRMNIWVSSVAVIVEATDGLAATWTHYALVRNSGTLTLYRNGIQTGSVANTTNFNNTSTLGIGAYGSTGQVGSYSVNGYIDDLRITKGIARYTANFTPPGAL